MTEEVKSIKKSKNPAIVIGVIAAIIIVMGSIFFFVSYANSPEKKLAKQLDLGNKYLDDEDYERAIAAFDKAIDIDSKCVDAYLGKAEAYVALGDYENAIDVLTEGYEETEDKKIQRELSKLVDDYEEEENFSEGMESGEEEQAVQNSEASEELSVFDSLCETGDTGNLLMWQDVTILGVRPDTYDFDGWVSYAMANGFVYGVYEDYSMDKYWCADNSQDEHISIYQSEDAGGIYLSISLSPGYDTDMLSFCGIPFGRNDSSGDILVKLGMSNGNEIMDIMESYVFSNDEEWPDASWSNYDKYPGFKLEYLSSASCLNEEGTMLTYKNCGSVCLQYEIDNNYYSINFPNDANTSDYKLWEISIFCMMHN